MKNYISTSISFKSTDQDYYDPRQFESSGKPIVAMTIADGVMLIVDDPAALDALVIAAGRGAMMLREALLTPVEHANSTNAADQRAEEER